MSGNTLGLNIVVQGAGAAVSEAQKVAGALKGVGTAAKEASEKGGGSGGGGMFGGLTASMGKAGPLAVAAAAGMKVFSDAMGEVAENDRAEVALRKFGISAEEASKHAELLGKLELFKDGDAAQAAELFGKALKGSGQELKQYGITLKEGATEAERIAAATELAERGVVSYAQKNETMTGAIGAFYDGVTGKLGNAISAVGTVGTKSLGFINQLFGFAPSTEQLEAAKKKLEEYKAAAEAAARVEAMVVQAHQQAEQATKETKAAVDALNTSLSAQKTKAEAVTTAFQNLAQANAQLAGAQVDKAEAKGEITGPDAARAKARIQFEEQDTVLTAKEEALKEERDRLKAALKKAGEGVKPGDAYAARAMGDVEAQQRVDRFSAQEKIIQPQLDAAEAQLTIIKKQKETLDAQIAKIVIEADSEDTAAGQALADEIKDASKALIRAALKNAGDAIKDSKDFGDGLAEDFKDAAVDILDKATNAARRAVANIEKDDEKAAAQKEKSAEEIQGKSEAFLEKFGKGKNAQATLKDIVDQANRDGGGGDAFDNAAKGFTRKDKAGNERLRPREFSSSENESPLDRFKRESRPTSREAAPVRPPAPAAQAPQGGGDVAAAAQAAATATSTMTGNLATYLKTIEAKMNAASANLTTATAKANANTRTAGQGGG